MSKVLKKPVSGNSRASVRLGAQDHNHGNKKSELFATLLDSVANNSLLDKISHSHREFETRVKNVVVCTHATFSTIELCRILASHEVKVTFHPVDYSTDIKCISRLQGMGIQVIENPQDMIPFIEKADCAIEDGARISKIINASQVVVKSDFFSVEQTSGGVRYFKENPPKYPVIDVAMSPVKLDTENKRATPEGVIQYFSSSTGKMLGGKRVLVLGFGSIGEGIARLSRVMGARVTVYDMLATKRMFAKNQGYETVEKNSLDHILPLQDVIIMATNTYQGTTLSIEQFLLMKDETIVCNAGSGRGELGLELQEPGEFMFHDAKVTIKECDGHLKLTLTKGDYHKTITILGKAFPLNLHLGDGTSHDAIQVVMAMLLSAALRGPKVWEPGLHDLDADIQENIAQLILDNDCKKQFKPCYVKSRGLGLSARPYGGVFTFHNQLSSDANVSVVRAWFKAGTKTRGHYHRRSQEAYYVERGTADIIIWPYEGSDAKEVFSMDVGDYLLVPEGYYHDVKVTSEEDFESLVIATPPFQLWDQFFDATDAIPQKVAKEA